MEQNNKMNPIFIKPIYGLANRILALTSAIRLASSLDRPLFICWTPDWYNCNASYSDLFKPSFPLVSELDYAGVQRVNIIEGNIVDSIPDGPFYIEYCHYFNLFNTSIDPEMSLLQPVDSINDEIFEYLDLYDLSKVIGVHIRKGDKMPLASTSENYVDNLIIMEIQRCLRTEGSARFFVCSDAPIKKYIDIFGDRILYTVKTDYSRNLTGVREAMVDLFLLSKTSRIIRSAGSFGLCAALMANNSHINLFSDREFIMDYRRE